MWRAVNPDGSLAYTFVETVTAIRVYDMIRAVGGALYLSGALFMLYNVWRTVRQGTTRVPAPAPAGRAVAAALGAGR
jgi:cytochrome c oxidase cbb3-type subunit 1